MLQTLLSQLIKHSSHILCMQQLCLPALLCCFVCMMLQPGMSNARPS
jgi:hypothetical protein